MRKWGNGNRYAKLGRQTGGLVIIASETMVYLTEHAVD